MSGRSNPVGQEHNVSPVIRVTMARSRVSTAPVRGAAIVVIQWSPRLCFVEAVRSSQDKRLRKERRTLRKADTTFFRGVEAEPVLENA